MGKLVDFTDEAFGQELWIGAMGAVETESDRPTTNFPGISVDTNRFDYKVEKSGLDVDPWRLANSIEQGKSRHVGV